MARQVLKKEWIAIFPATARSGRRETGVNKMKVPEGGLVSIHGKAEALMALGRSAMWGASSKGTLRK
jgi:hypothetical protein